MEEVPTEQVNTDRNRTFFPFLVCELVLVTVCVRGSEDNLELGLSFNRWFPRSSLGSC